jgi:pyruvate,orthophosphate dikinase
MENLVKQVAKQHQNETVKKIQKYVYSFGQGDGKNKQLLGGKGANLCEMTQIGLNVPPGFVISTEACMSYLSGNKQLPGGVMQQVLEHMKEVERASGKKFGNAADPLLVSVRSGLCTVYARDDGYYFEFGTE